MDKILAVLRPDIKKKSKEMENELIKKFKVDYFWHLTTKCPNCKSFQRGIAIFCSTCLNKEKEEKMITPRLKGCRNNCFANPMNCCEENYNGVEDLKEQICIHERGRIRGMPHVVLFSWHYSPTMLKRMWKTFLLTHIQTTQTIS